MVRERSRRSLPLATTAGAVLVLAAAPAAADLYRWVDAKGVVNYSNVPPPQSVKAKRIAETEPTVSVIPPREDRAERLQAAREAALLRRIEQLEEELAALRSTPAAPTVVYTYPAPATAVTYPTSYVYPYPVYARPFGKPGRVHGFKPRHRGFGAHRAPGAAKFPGVASPRSGLTVRARF